MKLILNKDYIAVTKLATPQRSSGGITLGSRTEYRVIDVGENVKFCKSLDLVLLNREPMNPVLTDNGELYFVFEDDIVAKLEENSNEAK